MQNFKQIYDTNIFVREAMNLSNLSHSTKLLGYEHRLIYILEGGASILVSNNKITLNKRDILIISAGVPYKIIESCGKMLFFYFDLTMENSNISSRVFPSNTENFKKENIICKYRLLYNGAPFDYQVFRTIYGLSDILLKICNVNDKKDSVTNKYKASLLTAAIAKAFFNDNEHEKGSVVGKKAKRYIDENYSKDITITDAASFLSYHESYINRQIKKETGMAFHQYLLSVRLNKALEILNGHSSISIERVATLVGFSDPKYFATCFKKHFNITPSKAKKLL